MTTIHHNDLNDDMNIDRATTILEKQLPISLNISNIHILIDAVEIPSFYSENEITFILTYYCDHTITEIYKKQFPSLKLAFQSLHNSIRNDGSLRYSKITDGIYENDQDMKTAETIQLAKWFLIKYKPECTVCYNVNIVMTTCNHNVCRFCFSKMLKINSYLCPICRFSLIDIDEE